TGPLLAGTALALTAGFAVAIGLPGLRLDTVLLVSDLGQLAAAGGAALACGWAATRALDRRRRAWWLLAAGTGSWALGQLAWTYYEVVLGRQVPFPSVADVGFLAFPVFAAIGLLCWSGAHHSAAARGRDVLDGSIIAGSLLLLSWVTTLGTVVAGSSGGWLAVTLSLAYPIGDVVLGTLVLLAVVRAVEQARGTLLLLAAGLGGLSFADSAYVYLVAVGSYTSGDLVTAGWVLGFLLVTAGALADRPPAVTDQRADQRLRTASRLRLLLPYAPLLVAGVVMCTRLVQAGGTSLADLGMGVVLVALVLARQFFAMAENQRLLADLEVAREQLQQLALHDPLTGLANRALFGDRLHRALADPTATVAVLFCDLDDFKTVNDELGHEAGDELLRLVAQRLLHCVRSEDTVARLGGDEFAVLLPHESRAENVAGRIVAHIQQPYRVGSTEVHTSVSVGIAAHRGTEPGSARPGTRLRAVPTGATTAAAGAQGFAPRDEVARRLLKRADTAMYGAKAAGKGRARVFDEPSAAGLPAPLTI
ncbi:MAG: GGDEF domain-containing protein, partial [Actinomycetota bacterium]|nr:GGDEF domain-containing protein [Actinomycetota bacterium]